MTCMYYRYQCIIVSDHSSIEICMCVIYGGNFTIVGEMTKVSVLAGSNSGTWPKI